eukprot:3992951-Alexandrium_andersonii.AAC.1
MQTRGPRHGMQSMVRPRNAKRETRASKAEAQERAIQATGHSGNCKPHTVRNPEPSSGNRAPARIQPR